MGPKTVNKVKDSEICGDFVGRDKIINIIIFKDSEREFIVTHNANIKPVSYFTGRETELQELRQRIEEGRKSVMISGMGGIGKTHICRKLFKEYIDKHVKNHDNTFKHIGYIEYGGDMDSSLQNCLKFKQQDDPKQNQEAAWMELETLAAGGQLLLFVDNVNKTMGEDPSLQKLKSIPGVIILTSRQASFSDEFESYQIGFLGMEQCKNIYEKVRFGNSGKKVGLEEDQDLEYIIESLAGRHTITVELLAHLACIKLWTVKELLEELEKKGFRLEFHKGGEIVNIQKSYEMLYDLSKLTDAEKNILEAFSVFPYISLAAKMCNEWLLEDAGVSEDDDILIGLYQKGWLQFDMEQESYGMHPVFAQFIYEKYKPHIKKHLGLIEKCQERLKIPESGSILECQKYIPFAENIIKKVNMGKKLEAAVFMSFLGQLLSVIGEYEKAEITYKKALRICKPIKNINDRVICYNKLAEIYILQKNLEKANEMCTKALFSQIFMLRKDDYNIATSMHNLAKVNVSQNQYKIAEVLYNKCLKILIQLFGEEYSDTAVCFCDLAELYKIKKEYEKAEILYKKGLVILEKIGKEHPTTAALYNNLAEIYLQKGDYKKALVYLFKAYNILLCKYGLEHKGTKQCYQNMKMTYLAQKSKGNFEQWLKNMSKNKL